TGTRDLASGIWHLVPGSFLGRRWAAAARDLVRFDLPCVEPSRARDHLVDGLVEIGHCLALKAQWVDTGDDERLEVRALETARLHALHCFVHEIVQLEELVRPLATRRKRRRQLGGEEFVAALEDRMIRAS